MWFSIDVNGKHLEMIDFHRKRFSSDKMWEADRFIYLLKPPPWIINSTYVSLSTSPPFSEYRMNAGGDGGGGYRYRWCGGQKRLINPAPASAAGILIPAASSSREHGCDEDTYEGRPYAPQQRSAYRVFSKGRNEVDPTKSLIFGTFSDVLGFFRPFNMGDFSFWYFWDIWLKKKVKISHPLKK